MRSIEKSTWLAMLESKTEVHISDAILYFQNLDENDLNKPSASGGWSIAQCLEHLNTYGHYYLPLLEKEIGHNSKSDISNEYAESWLGAYLIKLMDSEKSKKKFKAVKKHQPLGCVPASQIVSEFIDQQEKMLALLRKAQNVDLKRAKIPLSVAFWIRLPLGDILYFMVVHSQRHILQAKRNLVCLTRL